VSDIQLNGASQLRDDNHTEHASRTTNDLHMTHASH
jgi:hypothetical protein